MSKSTKSGLFCTSSFPSSPLPSFIFSSFSSCAFSFSLSSLSFFAFPPCSVFSPCFPRRASCSSSRFLSSSLLISVSLLTRPHPEPRISLTSVPVSRTRRYMKQGRYAKIIQQRAAVYLGKFSPSSLQPCFSTHFADLAAAVLEYLVAEMVELSGNAARDSTFLSSPPFPPYIRIMTGLTIRQEIPN